MEDNFNGFSTEEKYNKALEICKNSQEENDIFNFDRDTIALYWGKDCMEFYLDRHIIVIWDNQVEINSSEYHIDNGVLQVAWDLQQHLENGDFDFVFKK